LHWQTPEEHTAFWSVQRSPERHGEPSFPAEPAKYEAIYGLGEDIVNKQSEIENQFSYLLSSHVVLLRTASNELLHRSFSEVKGYSSNLGLTRDAMNF
jgi:hypothetical protein